eukprot:scaffold266781_cov17-Prasinocladus_malaysianus.AAC.1
MSYTITCSQLSTEAAFVVALSVLAIGGRMPLGLVGFTAVALRASARVATDVTSPHRHRDDLLRAAELAK